MNIQNAIKEASQILKKKNISSFNLDSEVLMSEAIKKNREYILLNLKKSINQKNLNYYRRLINSRSIGKPVAYLTGKKEFWKNEFEITEDVLIPRPDTELIVDHVLKLTKNKKKLHILDIGVGSGCILLSIINEKKDFYGTGIDLSSKCLSVCSTNASKLNLNNRVKFFNSDIDNFDYGKYDIIISNPPYINKLDLKYLDKDVLNFEPKLALDGGLEGLSEIRKIISKSSELIKQNGKLVLEIAFDQKEKVKKILRNKGFYINKVLKDLAKNDRCIISTKI
ncbi:peptide chain release factor N(5)-glutamine methyltransferase [Candidatus Pelagibacter sp.]|nr:peptide chain release factor N(5)-glutamine methyltransferase [Candidatus Pelagibacter sp.]